MTTRLLLIKVFVLVLFAVACKSDDSSTSSSPTSAPKAAAPIHPGVQLLAKAPCKTCHNRKVKAIGPSYLAIADRYALTDDNVALLVNKVKHGGKGVWGEAVMNPHPQLSEPDIEQMVRYILSMKP